MINSISTKVFQDVSYYIEKTLGLYFNEKRYNDLIRYLSNAAKLKNMELEEYINYILLNTLSQEDFKNLAACLTIGETYFFRDKKLFSIIKQKILTNLINSRKSTSRSLKIWSAGCSSGEEVYSIAILIKELIQDYEDWNIKIIATDINHSFLNKAKKAIYSEWSFRGIDLNIKNKYFKKIENNQYELNKEIVELVEFHSLNLADSNYLIDNQIINNVDIIFCRNVLIYFSKNKINEIINRFYNTITNDGWLVVAPTESLFLNDTSFIPVNVDDMFLYNKTNKKSILVNPHNANLVDKNTLTTIRKVIPLSSIGGGDYLNMQTTVSDPFLKMGVKYPSEVVNNSMEDDTLMENNIFKGYNNLYSLVNKPVQQLEKIKIEEKQLQEDNVDVKKLEKLFRSYANEGRLEEAIECCEKAISVDKTNAFYYYFLASIHQEQGNITEAIRSLKKSIFLDYDFIMAYFDLGNLNLKQEKYEEAFKNFEIVYDLLNNFTEEEIIPYSEEMNVGDLKKIIENINSKGDSYGEM